MSQHRSLKGASTIATKRNVLKRFERGELLKKRGLFKPGDKVVGLPKTQPDASAVRLNRFLARAGVASRRGAEEFIRHGRVTINGALSTELATQVESTDQV